MKLLVLSFYYTPDLSAGSFRTAALVRALVEQLPPGSEIDVVTTLPNRYRSFTVDVPAFERHGPVSIHRIALPAHQSGMLDQSRAFVAFANGAMRVVSSEQYALVYATSSRLMTGALGSMVARRQRVPLYLDIRDIFVDNITEVLPRPAAVLIRPVLSLLERFTFTKAARVNLVSPGFAEYFKERYPHLTYSFFTNGIDDEFLPLAATPSRAAPPPSNGVRTVVYAGNIGEGQGLHEILPGLASRMRGRAKFRVIGDGGRRRALEEELAASGSDNVEMIAPMGRARLIEEYRAADVLFLHLNDYEAFKKLLPSKVFEYAATGKAIWAGVGGFAAAFVREHVDNAAVFAPCDVAGAERAFAQLDLAQRPRQSFVDRFSRRAISTAMAADVIGTISRHKTS